MGSAELPQEDRAPGKHETAVLDSIQKQETIDVGGKPVDVRSSLVTAQVNVDAATLADPETAFDLAIEMSNDGGQTWRVMAVEQYRASKEVRPSMPIVKWGCKVRADLTTGERKFRASINNLGPKPINADCKLETDQ